MTAEELAHAAQSALAAGRWAAAREGFEAALTQAETAEARFGLGTALWWLGENRASVAAVTRAFVLYRRQGEVAAAAQCAVWLAVTYKANFANDAAANGWVGRADRLLADLERGPLHAWVWLARAYRMPDLGRAAQLTERALGLARDVADADLELVALSQLGLIRVGQGEVAAGFAMIDEALAAALAGEAGTLDTVVYACCDMLNACELAADVDRAAQWCEVADGFVDRYGCPFLYAECRIYYGSLLTSRGRWVDAERELDAGMRISAGASPGLHARALTRLADLRVRQGRLEEADLLLAEVGHGVEAEAETALHRAALLLARGDAAGARDALELRLHQLEAHRTHLAGALDLLTDAHLAAADVDAAAAAAGRLGDLAEAAPTERLRARAAGARGRVLLARGDADAAALLEAAAAGWSRAGSPLEEARARSDLARALVAEHPAAAAEHAGRALQTFQGLGASIDVDRVAEVLRSLGVAARPGRRGAGVLTDRERQVLALLATGLANPEIARRLHISRKTAAHHVSSILTKLDLRNRTEAAAYAVTAARDPAAPQR